MLNNYIKSIILLFVFACGTNTNLCSQTDLIEYPDSLGVHFSVKSGFYFNSFELTMTSPIQGAIIVYTLDGSNPQTSTTSINAVDTVTVNISPFNTGHRGSTPGVVVRASLFEAGYKPSKPISRTYLFINQVRNQTYPGWDWPSDLINEQVFDYNMDVDITHSVSWGSQIEDALLDIPSISVVTDNVNLFDDDLGIYVNAMRSGPGWERECTVELLNPDGTEGFNVNAGLRIRGGWSRHPEYPKHAFRLFFKSQYGDSKLRYPLFEEEGVDRFDKMDLRCAQNYSWSNWDGKYNTFIREVFLRDAQGAAGKPYTRSRYYHLYLNGLYMGLYQTQERSEAHYASDYLGGDNEDWDVLKPGNGIEATDGNNKKWFEVWNISNLGYGSNANYYLLEGRDENGRPMKNSEVLVDIDNLIDYMINIFYSGNFDAPVSKFGANKAMNNFYMLNNREDKSSGFIFMVHDAEHAMMYSGVRPGSGLNENRVEIGYLENEMRMTVGSFNEFHPQWLHHKLVQNQNYRDRFANLAYKRLANNGIFTKEKNIERLNKRAEQIELAIIAESARWGDSHSSLPFSKTDWELELDILRDKFFHRRNSIVIKQLKEYGLYHTIDAPVIKMNDNIIWDEYVPIEKEESITISAKVNEIYYTIDGTDPRAINGDLAPTAKQITSGDKISIPGSAIIKIRAVEGANWSAVREISFLQQQLDFSKFKVTELHYHPTDSIMDADTINGKNYEFIEFKNTSYTNAINLTGISIDSAISFTFPDNTLLAPQQYFVIAAKPKKFYDRYGLIAGGNFQKSLSNSAEQVLVTDSSGNVIMDFTYMDSDPWPTKADGNGASLVSVEVDPTGDPNDYNYWTASLQEHGSPKTNGWVTAIKELHAISDDFKLYPNPTNDIFNVNYYGDAAINYNVKLFDIKGSLIYQNKCCVKATIPLSGLGIDYGVYMVKIEAEGYPGKTMKVIYTP